MARRWKGLTQKQRLLIVAGVVALLVLIGSVADAVGDAITPSRSIPARSLTPDSQNAPKATYREVTESEPIPYTETTKHDPLLTTGTTYVETEGVDGVVSRTYRVKFVNDEEVSRELIKEEVTKQPVAEVTLIGTYNEAIPDAGNCFPVYDYDGDGRPC